MPAVPEDGPVAAVANGMVNQRRRLAAADAGRIGGEKYLALPLPFGVVAALPRRWTPGVEARFALPVARHGLAAALTVLVNAAAMAADAGSAGGHDQATGAMAARPFTTTAPAAIEVPPALVRAMRMKRFLPK